MATYTVKLKSRITVAEGTKAFHFEKPNGFQFKAGQFARLTLLHPAETDENGNRRQFTIASAPHESELIFAMRMRDTAFKRCLGALPIESEVQLDGPLGMFTLHEDPLKLAVFLTGGIGITPAFAILKDAAEKKLSHHVFLFYSNRRSEDTPFMKELRECETKNENVSVIFTMTEPERSQKKWEGKTGYISADMMLPYLGSFANTMFYITGPAAMVEAMFNMLKKAGVKDEAIRTEEFSGY